MNWESIKELMSQEKTVSIMADILNGSVPEHRDTSLGDTPFVTEWRYILKDILK